jgi:hypothetical protein
MSTLARQPDKALGTIGEAANGDGQGGQSMAQAARRASMGQREPYHLDQQRQQQQIQQQQFQQQQQQQQQQHVQQQQQQQQSQLQAQRMYPNHPLLNSASPHVSSNQWFPTSASMNNVYGSPVDTFVNPILSAPPTGGFHIGRSGSMRVSPSDVGPSSSSMGRGESGSSVGSYDYPHKKKACDQCNHSKVKCDVTQPCRESLSSTHRERCSCSERCSNRNLCCTYNKPNKARSIAMTPGQSYTSMPPVSGSTAGTPYTGMPSGSGTSQSPMSHFSTSPNMTASPLHHQSFAQPMAHASASPVNSMSLGLSTQGNLPYLPVDAWTNMNTYLEPSLGSSSGQPQQLQPPPQSQSLGMYMPPTSATSQMPPLAPLNTGVPITNGYASQILNRRESTSQSPHTLPLQTPSLISHTTSPSSSDELDRKSSLIGSVSSINPTSSLLQKGHSFSSDTSTGGIRISPDTKPVMLPLQINTANDLYQNSNLNSGYMFDPTYQMRQQQSLIQSDDESDPLSSTTPIFNEHEEPAVTARRRSSLGIYANAFNQMTLQDGTLVNTGMVPDPYTAVEFAQRLSAQPQRPSFPMATLEEGTEPSKIASSTDLKDAWKAFMQDPNAGTPAQEKEINGESTISIPRPGMGRTMSKSNSASDLTSPSLAHQIPPYSAEETGPPQAQLMLHGQTAPSGDMSRETWDAFIAQRQASFSMQPTNKFSRNTPGSNGNVAMLPPPFNSRPLASIMQYSGALNQTLGPERAPSFGSTPNSEKPNPTSTWSRTPSKLARTPATARPGNKRMPSQTLGPEAKKRSASFSVWDENETDEGELGDSEDNDNSHSFGWNGFPNMSYQPLLPTNGNGNGNSHARSASMNNMGGSDLSMFINPNHNHNAPSTSTSTIPMSMMPQSGPSM